MSKPLYHAYVVTKRSGKKDYWNKIGAVFPHKDGKGHDLVLDGKLVLRVPLPAKPGKNAKPQKFEAGPEDSPF